MINSALLLCLGLCREFCRAEALGSGCYGRNDPLKSIEMVSEGSRMLAAPTGCQSCEHKHSAQLRGCVCAPIPPVTETALIYTGRHFISATKRTRTREKRTGEQQQRRGQRAGLQGDSASTSCRARLALPPCPAHRADFLSPSRTWELPYHKQTALHHKLATSQCNNSADALVEAEPESWGSHSGLIHQLQQDWHCSGVWLETTSETHFIWLFSGCISTSHKILH